MDSTGREAVSVAVMLWRRLDTPGHDACRLEATTRGARLEGAATFLHEGLPASLTYHIMCDADWRTRTCAVQGWLGVRAVDFRIAQTPGETWMLNDVAVPDVTGCIDVDLGFTPATNLLQLRRVALGVGHSAAVPVAWLDAGAGVLDLLEQQYERRTATTYWYEAPRFNYRALLEVSPEGFVRHYPSLWSAEA